LNELDDQNANQSLGNTRSRALKRKRLNLNDDADSIESETKSTKKRNKFKHNDDDFEINEINDTTDVDNLPDHNTIEKENTPKKRIFNNKKIKTEVVTSKFDKHA